MDLLVVHLQDFKLYYWFLEHLAFHPSRSFLTSSSLTAAWLKDSSFDEVLQDH
jgi:hypothetical protein